MKTLWKEARLSPTRQLQLLPPTKHGKANAGTHPIAAGIFRRWVETGDERCPLACVWFGLRETTQQPDDESDRTMPASSRFWKRQAGRFTRALYLRVKLDATADVFAHVAFCRAA